MINFSTEKLNSQCEVSQQQSQLGPRMVTINSLFSKRLQKILSFYLYFLRAIRCISIKFYKSHCIKLNKYMTDLGGQKRGGKKKGDPRQWKTLIIHMSDVSYYSLLCFPPTAPYNSDEFADVLFIEQQHWGMQIAERQVKEWINQWIEEEAPSDVITRLVFHRF